MAIKLICRAPTVLWMCYYCPLCIINVTISTSSDNLEQRSIRKREEAEEDYRLMQLYSAKLDKEAKERETGADTSKPFY